MLHYTLNTGDIRVSPRSEVGDAAIRALQSTLAVDDARYDVPGMDGYLYDTGLAVGALFCTVAHGDRVLCMFCVADTEAIGIAVWPEFYQLYLDFVADYPVLRASTKQSPIRPESAPWCAAIVLDCTPLEALWLGDFERCLAWAWIEYARRKRG